MSDTDLRDQLMTLLLAGHETTATALAWTFDLLLRHPAALTRLRDSLEAGRGRLPAGGDHRVAAAAAGGPAGRPAARRGRWSPTTWRCRRAPTSPRRSGSPTPGRRLSGAARLPARALPRGRARDLLLDPVRRQRPALPRRRLRRVRDADRAARGPDPLRPPQGRPRRRSASPAATSPSRRATGRRVIVTRPQPRARAASWPRPSLGGGPRARVLPRPARDRARAGDHLAVVEDEDRHLVGAAQLLRPRRGRSSRLPQVQGISR